MNNHMSDSSNTVLRVENLCVDFQVRGNKQVSVLSDISFHLDRGETLGIIGESGCGKSMTALSLIGLIPSPPGRISGGKIFLNGKDLTALGEREMRLVRGREISMIFQEPMTSLNPVYTVGDQISETIRCHKDISARDAMKQAVDLLRLVEIPRAEARVNDYPYQLSGGMRQRVMIAIALSCEPTVLIADEPTTALDVTVQAQILDLLKQIQQERGTSIILITHDFGVVAETAQRVMVMYAGHKVEEGSVEEINEDARHPYTRGLLNCMPEIMSGSSAKRDSLPIIPGTVPDLLDISSGCPFEPRCSFATPQCSQLPPNFNVGAKRVVKCWLAEENAPVRVSE